VPEPLLKKNKSAIEDFRMEFEAENTGQQALRISRTAAGTAGKNGGTGQ